MLVNVISPNLSKETNDYKIQIRISGNLVPLKSQIIEQLVKLYPTKYDLIKKSLDAKYIIGNIKMSSFHFYMCDIYTL